MRVQVLVAVLAVASVAADASAQTRRATGRTSSAGASTSQKSILFGAHASYANESDLGLGARALWSPRSRLGVITSLDYFFPSGTEGVVTVDSSHWELNGNLAYHFGRRWRPYAGPGLNVARRSAELAFLGQPTGAATETSLGLNVLGGVRRVNGSKRQYFAEARYELGGGEQFLVAAGVLF